MKETYVVLLNQFHKLSILDSFLTVTDDLLQNLDHKLATIMLTGIHL